MQYDAVLAGAHSGPSKTESNYGATATRQKVRWYQTILSIAGRIPGISINGDHNDPATRATLRQLQQQVGLEPTSYLTVASNAALTQMALEWIYRIRIPNKPGDWSPALRDAIIKFQRVYGLEADGKPGPATRDRMMDVLQAKLPTPIKNFHSHLGPGNFPALPERVEEELEAEPSGILGADDRRTVPFPAAVPWRWICRIEIDGMWAGTGLLIGPRHVLTAGHIVHADRNDLSGFRRYATARTLVVSPAFDGHLLRRNRQFNRHAPFGKWPVDMSNVFLPSCYIVANKNGVTTSTNDDCDLAVLTLKTAIGTKRFTATKTIRDGIRTTDRISTFDPLGYWGIDRRHTIEMYQPGPQDSFSAETGGYPGSSHGIMQYVSSRIDNTALNSNVFDPKWKNAIDLYLNRFVHRSDTTPGQSGSPVWRPGVPGVRSLIGVVTQATSNRANGASVQNYNVGVALSGTNLQAIAAWGPKTFQYDGQRLRVR